jgi:hypothetical protein
LEARYGEILHHRLPPPGDNRPQLDDIQKPISQEIYYENGVAKVKVSMRIYISSEDEVKKFEVIKH